MEDIPADSVIFAIGQSSDLSFLDPADGVQSERGLIKVNRETYQTTAPDVFACGDIAHGARLFIDAIASAQIAARSMHDFLRRTRTDIVVRKQWSPALLRDGRALECDRADEPADARKRAPRRGPRKRRRGLRRGRSAPAGLALPALQRQHGNSASGARHVIGHVLVVDGAGRPNAPRRRPRCRRQSQPRAAPAAKAFPR